jgi:hypothetical protein
LFLPFLFYTTTLLFISTSNVTGSIRKIFGVEGIIEFLAYELVYIA